MLKGDKPIERDHLAEQSVHSNPKRSIFRDKTIVPGKNGEEEVVIDNNFNEVPKQWRV